MLVLLNKIVAKLIVIIFMVDIYCMQLSILVNKVYMLNLKKLFFRQKRQLKNRICFVTKNMCLKKCSTYTSSQLVVFCVLSLSSHSLFAEGIITQLTDFMSTDKQSASMADKIIANQNGSLANEITYIVTTKNNPYLQRPDFKNRSEDIETLYKTTGYKLLWLGSPEAEKNGAQVLDILEKAAVNGLNPNNYDAQSLKQKRPAALNLASDNYKQLALYDTAVSISLLRFLHDLHYGRVNPKAINFNLKLRDKKLIDLPALINQHLEQDTVLQLPELLEPKFKQYQNLKKSLATYRVLAKTPVDFNMEFIKSINPGDVLTKATSMEQFLIAVGDVPAETLSDSKKSNRYTDELVAGVKKFQLRHGMNADGVLGKSTVAAMTVPLSQRVTQIELAMERLRWLPEPSSGASIIVNIPAFQLWAFDDVNEINANMPNMRVVVGKALKNETPVLMAEMRFIDFMPYWNVPYNIVKKEILPKIIQNPGYLEAENMELVTTFGNETKAVSFNSSTISGLKQGTLRIRQRPGQKNALGKVKFIFPNKSDVYLHDTPSHSLFSRSRRDFSHGCVRVANPEQLAEFVLKNQWTKEAIEDALATQKTRRVILKKSIPVLFFYVTSFIDQYDNVAFYSDIYGYDAVLQEALNKSVDVSDKDIFAPLPALVPVEVIAPKEPIKPEADLENDGEP